MYLQHVLVLALVAGFPLWDWYEIPRLKASADPRKRTRFYRKVIAAEWACTTVALAAMGFRRLYWIQPLTGESPWLARGSAGLAFASGMLGAMAVALIAPAVLSIWSEKVRSKVAKAVESLAYLIPATKEDRLWWWPLCLTAGICEEILYRGFLLQYFQQAPFHLSLTRAMVASALVFGIGHLYQGVKGAFGTAVLGFAFSLVFVITGSLLIPIVAHALMDLRVLVLVPARPEPQQAAT